MFLCPSDPPGSFLRRYSPPRARAASFLMFIDHSWWNTTVCRTPLNEGSATVPLPDITQRPQETGINAPGGFFLFSCTLYFSRTWVFVFTVLYFAVCLYLQHTTQTSMSPAGFEPAIPGSDRSQTLALDRSATGIGATHQYCDNSMCFKLHESVWHTVGTRCSSLVYVPWQVGPCHHGMARPQDAGWGTASRYRR